MEGISTTNKQTTKRKLTLTKIPLKKKQKTNDNDPTERQRLIGSRKVWRIDKYTNEKLECYETLRDAAKWAFDNKLTSVKEFNDGTNIKSNICEVCRKRKNTHGYPRKTAFGYKWEYDGAKIIYETALTRDMSLFDYLPIHANLEECEKFMKKLFDENGEEVFSITWLQDNGHGNLYSRLSYITSQDEETQNLTISIMAYIREKICPENKIKKHSREHKPQVTVQETKKTCCVCLKTMWRTSYYRHVRTKHPEKMVELEIPPIKRRKKLPERFSFILNLVGSCIAADVKWERVISILPLEERKIITYKVIAKMKENDQYDTSINNLPCFDDYGGYLSHGFSLHAHSLFKLSLDRINNSKKHFVDGGLSNIRLIIQGMNHRTNPCNFSIREMRKKNTDPIDKNIQQQLLHRVNNTSRRKLIPYSSAIYSFHKKYTLTELRNICTSNGLTKEGTREDLVGRLKEKNIIKNEYCDPCRNHWSNIPEMWNYYKNLLCQQKFVCPITNFLMSDTSDNSSPGKRLFAPTLDAYPDTNKGHVPGNIRWICSFLNNSNFDKQKNENFEDDEPTAWNKKLWMEYLYGPGSGILVKI